MEINLQSLPRDDEADASLEEDFLKMLHRLEAQKAEIEEEEMIDDIVHDWPIFCRVFHDRILDVQLMPPRGKFFDSAPILLAIESLNAELSRKRENPRALIDRGWKYLQLADAERAELDFSCAMTFRPRDESLYLCSLGLALVSVRSGKYGQALSTLESLVDLPEVLKRPQFATSTPRATSNVTRPLPYCLFLRGVLNEMKGEYVKAIGDLTAAFELGKLLIAQRERAFCFLAIGDTFQAQNDINSVVDGIEWEAIIDEDPIKLSRSYVYRAEIYMRCNQFDKALGDINQAIQNPAAANENPGWLLLRGKIYIHRQQYELAARDFEYVIERPVLESTNLYNTIPLNHAVRLRGEAFYLNQEIEKAIEDGITAVQYDPNALSVFDWLIDAFYKSKDYHGAASLLYEIIETKKLNKRAHSKLRHYFEEAKKKQEDVLRSLGSEDRDVKDISAHVHNTIISQPSLARRRKRGKRGGGKKKKTSPSVSPRAGSGSGQTLSVTPISPLPKTIKVVQNNKAIPKPSPAQDSIALSIGASVQPREHSTKPHSRMNIDMFDQLLSPDFEETLTPRVESPSISGRGRKGSAPDPPAHSHFFDHFVNPIYVPPSSERQLKRSLSADSPKDSGQKVSSQVEKKDPTTGFDRSIGKLSWNSADIIGRGSGGTLVYKGDFDGTRCAIKCLVKAYWPKYEAEIQKLLFICMERDDLPSSIVRYYGKEEDVERIYLSLELCDCTLAKFLDECPRSEFLRSEKLSALQELSSAVAFLHKLNIVHNDINPRNILISKRKFKLADLGLSKWLKDEHSSYTFSNEGPVGTGGWYAQEVLSEGRKTRKVDIFSLGVVFHFILSHGANPFGDKFYSYVNIKDGKAPAFSSELTPLEIQLVSSMISHDPDERLEMSSVQGHPLFWSTSKLLTFVKKVSNTIDQSPNEVKFKFEEFMRRSMPPSWKSVVDVLVWKHLTQYRPYVDTSYTHLLRAIRNLSEHWASIVSVSPEVASLLKSNDGIYEYFSSKFPALTSNVWNAVSSIAVLSPLLVRDDD